MPDINPAQPEKIDHGRRLFGKTAAAAVLSSVSPRAEGQRVNRADTNALDVMSRFSFVDQNGKKISGSALPSLIGANPFTTSFGFGDCEKFCPTGNSIQGYLGANARKNGYNIKHVIINVHPDNPLALATKQDPPGEIIRKEFRDKFKKNILFNKNGSPTGADENSLIILYPLDSAGKPSDEAAREISLDLGNVTRAGYENHSAVMGLYNSSGKYQAHEILTPNSDHQKVTDKFINALKGQGAARI